MNHRILTVGCAAAVLVVIGCEREVRPFQTISVSDANAQKPVLSQLYPGAQPPPPPQDSPFLHNAYGMSEGKRLFDAYNCSGCHSHGGGGMGPPLMDDRWIYGSQPANIFATIVEGRPNGMPSFRNKMPNEQVWQLVAYVQAMSGQASVDVMPSRADHLRSSTPENARRAETPKQTGQP